LPAKHSVDPPVQAFFYINLFRVFAFVVGSMIGSFLNVVIYRLPLGLSVNEPRRSFCPHCKNQIPFYHNIPLFSWLLLRAKCAKCGSPIAFRYFGVELLTGVMFLLLWLKCDASREWLSVLPLWTFASLLIAATFIDFDHFIIPDEITIGGTLAGIVFSAFIPQIHGEILWWQEHAPVGLWPKSIVLGEITWWTGLLWALVGAGLGYMLLWGVVEAGKLAFGRKKMKFPNPVPFTWSRRGEEADLVIENETTQWSEIFSRESDLMIMETSEVTVDGEAVQESPLRFRYDRLLLTGKEVLLDHISTIAGKVSQIVIPREAMGFGDVKFIACIGAFLGWQAVLFTVFAASVVGSVVGVFLMLIGKREASGRIPFGPYLAFGALLWIFCGPQLVGWYIHLMPQGEEV
jgi:leader peptidase (prepilin peptidase)/N-methyltransferase